MVLIINHRKSCYTILLLVSTIFAISFASAQTLDQIILDGQPVSHDMVDPETGLLKLHIVRNGNEDVEIFVPHEYRIIKSSQPSVAIVEVTQTVLWIFKRDVGYLYVFNDVSTLNVVIGENKRYADNVEIIR